MPGPTPKGWQHCGTIGKPVADTRIVPLKTFFNGPGSEWTVEKHLLDWNASTEFPICAIVDLTNTSRYYDVSELSRNNIQHHKLSLPGHDVAPTKHAVQHFISVVNPILRDNPQASVGVHCTHGYNRTGFLIVSYLVEHADYTVEEALAAFTVARPPGLYKKLFVDELFSRYSQHPSSTFVYAKPPPGLEDCTRARENEQGGGGVTVPGVPHHHHRHHYNEQYPYNDHQHWYPPPPPPPPSHHYNATYPVGAPYHSLYQPASSTRRWHHHDGPPPAVPHHHHHHHDRHQHGDHSWGSSGGGYNNSWAGRRQQPPHEIYFPTSHAPDFGSPELIDFGGEANDVQIPFGTGAPATSLTTTTRATNSGKRGRKRRWDSPPPTTTMLAAPHHRDIDFTVEPSSGGSSSSGRSGPKIHSPFTWTVVDELGGEDRHPQQRRRHT